MKEEAQERRHPGRRIVTQIVAVVTGIPLRELRSNGDVVATRRPLFEETAEDRATRFDRRAGIDRRDDVAQT